SLRSAVAGDLSTLFLLLAGVSLVIGTVGIANTTLVAVLERTAEIGLRRALGARPRHVAAQFLAESTALGALGALLGTAVAVAVLILGVVALLTGPMVGGVIPATLALLLARSTRAEMAEAAGFLTGVRYVRWGETLAWIGIVLAATALVVASIVGLMHVAATPPGPHLH